MDAILKSLEEHNGKLMTPEEKSLFMGFHKILGRMHYKNIVCRWHSYSKSVSVSIVFNPALSAIINWFPHKNPGKVIYTLYRNDISGDTQIVDILDFERKMKKNI